MESQSSTVSSCDSYSLLTEEDYFFLEDGYLENYLLENPLEDLPLLQTDSLQYLANLEECMMEENLFEELPMFTDNDNTQILSSSNVIHSDEQDRQQKICNIKTFLYKLLN